MSHLFRRFRPFLIVVVLLVFAAGLLFKRNILFEKGFWGWISYPFVTVVRPAGWAVTWSKEKVKDVAQGYIYLVNLRQENKELQKNIIELKRQVIGYKEVEDENRRLNSIVGLRERVAFKTVSARVIADNPVSEFQMIVIDKGRGSGIERRDAVMTEEGLVGQVYSVMDDSAQVLLITDPSSSVDCIVERTRARTLSVGKVNRAVAKHPFNLTRLEYLEKGSEIDEGDIITTSGIAGVFPKGIPVGMVKDLNKDPLNVFISGDIIPSADLTNMEEVLVVTDFHQ